MRFWKRSLHDRILILIGWIVAIMMLVSACFLDSGDWGIFLGIEIACAAYLFIFTYANAGRGGVL